EAGRIRILHDRSFIDDPTRILRAIRYEDRYGFRMDDETVRLARECIATGHVGDLSGARLRDELKALLEEGDVSHAIPRLAELGAQEERHAPVGCARWGSRRRSMRTWSRTTRRCCSSTVCAC